MKWLGQAMPADTPSPTDQPASASPETLAQVEQSTAAASETPAQEGDWIPAETVPLDPNPTIVPPFTAEPLPEVKPVSTKLTDVVGGILNPTPTPAAPVFKSIAMQINDILQERIIGTPFESRGITVNDSPDHGVLVTVDGEKYPGVKDVPDEAVRAMIRAVVMEWEKQSRPASK